MSKTQKSKEKRASLLKATLYLMNLGGIKETSMSKVAKEATLSPGTIYLYFENKQDLLNQLYLESITSLSAYAFKDHEVGLPVKKSFEKIWYSIADFKRNCIEEASFLAQCDNTPMIDYESRKEGINHLQPLIDLWERGQQEEIIKELSPYLLYAYTIYPMDFLFNPNNNAVFVLDDKVLNDAFQAAWDSIKV